MIQFVKNLLRYYSSNFRGDTTSKAVLADYYGIAGLCDRIANVTFSIENKSSMKEMYAREYIGFYDELYDGRYQDMWDHLKDLLDIS